MKIKFLGTAAAEGFPAIWCECDTCRQARGNGGKDIRLRTSYLIDFDTIVDLGPDAFFQSFKYGIDLSRIDRIIYTHPHMDHLDPSLFIFRKDGCFSHVTRKIKVFGPASVFAAIMRYIADDCWFTSFDEVNVIPVPLSHGVPAEDGGIRITPINANHAAGRSPYVYVISRNGRSVLVGNDTGWLSEDSWKLLENARLDLAILDSTMGVKYADCPDGHMGVNVVVRFNERLKAIGALKDGSVTYANHFSHNGGNLHADLERFFTPHGIKVAYDGLELDI